MTGFGAGTSGSDRLSVTIEMRAVNQRFLELNIRMPHAYLILEEKLRRLYAAARLMFLLQFMN